MGGEVRTLREAYSSWLFSNSRSSATLSAQQLPLFSNSFCSATPAVEQISLFSNSLCSATPSIQQLFQFSNSFCSAFPVFRNSFNLATLSVQQLRLSIMQSLCHLLLLGLLAFVLVDERHVDAKPGLYLVETRDAEPAPPFYELPADDGLEMKIAQSISDQLRKAEAGDYGMDYGAFDKFLSVGKVLPSLGDIIAGVGKEMDVPLMGKIGAGMKKVAEL